MAPVSPSSSCAGLPSHQPNDSVVVDAHVRASSRTDDNLTSPSHGPDDEFVQVDLTDIRKYVQCPICLGIIRKTRTVMECLHRFCRECIDKSMRMGNNECPVCRTHCASRRSLRDDLNFDALIAALYPNVDTYEEEELALREEDERRNKQLQASIAETSERQSDAISRRCTTAKVTAAAIVRKAHSKLRNMQNQNRDRSQGEDLRYGGDDAEFMEQYGETIATEIASKEKRIRRRKRETEGFLLEASDDEQDEVGGNKALCFTSEKTGEAIKGETSTAKAVKLEGLVTWARAGARSHMRYGSLSNGNRNIYCTRATVLLEALSAADRSEIDVHFDVHFTLQPFNQSDSADKLPSLERPNLCCPANVTVQHICKFLVSHLSAVPAEELEFSARRCKWAIRAQGRWKTLSAPQN